MYRRVRRAARGGLRRLRATWIAGLATVIIAALIWPTTEAAAPGATAGREAMAVSSPLVGTAFRGNAAVGALFTTTGGRLGRHFCTASVVDSPTGNILVTAAHCMTSYVDASNAHLAFVPGFDNGAEPYGAWTVNRIFVNRAWATSADPDDDVAFLTVHPNGRDAEIQTVTGGERLGISEPAAGVVRVTGYLDSGNQPIACQNRVTLFSPSQLQFDCGDYSGGTSGSPFLTNVNPATGDGLVIGVIGGYQQGGNSPDVSYTAVFGKNVLALYETAVASGGSSGHRIAHARHRAASLGVDR
jgi:V8-like Glu-specific endopeptidase